MTRLHLNRRRQVSEYSLLARADLGGTPRAVDLILKAPTIITMEDAQPSADAIAVDTSTGQITAVGAFADVQA